MFCPLLNPKRLAQLGRPNAVWPLVLFGLLLLSSTGCAIPSPPTPSSPPDIEANVERQASPPSDSSSSLSNAPVPSPTPAADTAIDETAPSATLPEAVWRSVAQDIGQPANRLTLDSAIAQSWSDGCLGLAQPDEFCSMAIVDGWQVIASDGQTVWTYRSNADGTHLRREDEN